LIILSALAGGTTGLAERMNAIALFVFYGAFCLFGLAVVVLGVVLFLRYKRRLRPLSPGPASDQIHPLPLIAKNREARSSFPEPTERALPGSGSNIRASSDHWEDKLRALDWFQFEVLMETVYARKGYTVERRGGANPDGGVDLVIQKDGDPLAVQCKHWRTRDVGVRQVRELCGAMTDLGFKVGILVTLNGFTPDAKALAARNQIRLIEEKELMAMLRSLDLSYDPALQSCLTNPDKRCPKCERTMLKKTAKNGPGAGGEFWGCSGFPSCRTTLPL
jgi:hypothetical protein